MWTMLDLNAIAFKSCYTAKIVWYSHARRCEQNFLNFSVQQDASLPSQSLYVYCLHAIWFVLGKIGWSIWITDCITEKQNCTDMGANLHVLSWEVYPFYGVFHLLRLYCILDSFLCYRSSAGWCQSDLGKLPSFQWGRSSNSWWLSSSRKHISGEMAFEWFACWEFIEQASNWKSPHWPIWNRTQIEGKA